MSMKQKLQDTIAVLQESRKAQVIALCVICAGLFLFFNEPQKARRIAAPVQPESSATLANQELLDDLTTSLTAVTQQNKEELNALRSEVARQNEAMAEREQRVAEILNTMIEKMDQPTNVQVQGPYQPQPDALNPDTPIFPEEEPAQLEAFGSIADAAQVAPPPEPVDTRTAYIGKGDYVRVKLLAGVNAPTDGTPYPVLFKLISDVQGPDGTQLPLGEAHLLAAAQGSLTDSRVLYRLTNISVRLPDGERRDIGVDGYVIGEDGIRGMQGVPIDPLGKVLGATALTGFVDGLGQGIRSSQSNAFISDGNVFESVNGDVTSFAAGQGLSNASQNWSRIIQQRVQELVPAIQVFSGREATAAFTQSVQIPGLFEQINADETDIFGTLD